MVTLATVILFLGSDSDFGRLRSTAYDRPGRLRSTARARFDRHYWRLLPMRTQSRYTKVGRSLCLGRVQQSLHQPRARLHGDLREVREEAFEATSKSLNDPVKMQQANEGPLSLAIHPGPETIPEPIWNPLEQPRIGSVMVPGHDRRAQDSGLKWCAVP